MIRWFFRIIVLLCVVLIGGVWYGLSRVNHVLDTYHADIEELLTKKVGHKVQYDSLTISLGSLPKISTRGVTIAGVAQAESLEATIRLFPLISRRLEIAHLLVVAPVIDINGVRTVVAQRRNPPQASMQPASFGIDTSALTEGNFYFDIDSIEVKRGRLNGLPYLVEELSLAARVKFRNGERISFDSIQLATFFNKARLGIQGNVGVDLESKNISADDLLIAYDSNEMRIQGDVGYESGNGRLTLLESKFQVEKLLAIPSTKMLAAYNPRGTIGAKGTIALQRFNPKVSISMTISDGACFAAGLPVANIHGDALIEGSFDSLKVSVTSLSSALEEVVFTSAGNYSYPEQQGDIDVTFSATPLAVLQKLASNFYPLDELSQARGEVAGRIRLHLSSSRPIDFSGTEVVVTNVHGRYRQQQIEQLNGKISIMQEKQLSLKDISLSFEGNPIKVGGTINPVEGTGEVSVKSAGIPVSSLKQYLSTIPFTEGDVVLDGKLILDNWRPQFQGTIEVKEGVWPIVAPQLALTKVSLSTLISRAGANEQFFAIRDATGLVAQGEVLSLSAQGAIRTDESGTVDLKRADISIFGGSIAGNGSVGGRGVLSLSLKGIDLQRVAKVYPSIQGKVVGLLNGQIQMENNGARLITGTIQLRDGALKGVNVTKLAIEKLASIPLVGERIMYSLPQEFEGYLSNPDTQLRQGQLVFSEQDGTVSVNSLLVDFDAGEVHAQARLDEGTSELSGAMVVSLRRELSLPILQKNPGLRTFLNDRGMIQVPLNISGTIAEPKVTPDFESIGVAGVGGALLQALEKKLMRKNNRDRYQPEASTSMAEDAYPQ